jgi:3-methylcrotonyl-CoA carboxylase alpha subunit
VIKSLLVANRGEIACRIFRTARRLGVRTIAVYSDADAGARHAREADSALRLGPAPARESYLDAARILEAARLSGAEAIHPGYGFLSENAAFAAACSAAGHLFVGPPASSIAAMGSKILAKTRMQAAGVPVLPGYAGEQQDLEHLARAARELGLPLIVKPAAGGGGKGMQIVRRDGELGAALGTARRLAESAFGDGALLLERYLTAPRHLEVQVFADQHGNFVHLGERDCSIQRRHQKLIEEAPAPQVPEAVREQLRAAALVVARAVGYVGAGTVEFLYDSGAFYFMEMNTRLQVEHTVTEAVTGLDLVEWQLRVAAGEPLPLSQAGVRLSGHAIEARVCAEDPARAFLPSAGELALLEWPQGEAVRVDAGFSSGDRVPENYDSLLGKVIAWGETRAQAAARLAAALEATRCVGVHSNEHWLARIVRDARFLGVQHSIAFLDTAGAEFAERPAGEPELILAALAQLLPRAADAAPLNPWADVDGFTPNLPAEVSVRFAERGVVRSVTLQFSHGQPVAARVDEGPVVPLADVSVSASAVTARLGAQLLRTHAHRSATRLHLWQGESHQVLELDDPRTQQFEASAASGGLTTPLPGVVVSVPVQVGSTVPAGAVLMVIEAMKMEHAITAPHAGTVTAIHFAPGARVTEGAQLLELSAPP